MKFSSKGTYGLRALVDLALYSENGDVVSIRSISERQDMSERYLEQIIGLLRKAKIVKGIRGATGGYRLSRPASEITVYEILHCLEGNLAVVDCPEDLCNMGDSCVTRYVWKKITTAIERTVKDMSLQELVDQKKALPKRPSTTASKTPGNTHPEEIPSET